MTDADWLALEDSLFLLTQAELRSFADSHKGETFYGFVFDCTGIYGEVALNLNTEDHLRDFAEHQAGKPWSTLWADEMARFVSGRLGDPDAEKLVGQHAEKLVDQHLSGLPPFTPDYLAGRTRWSPEHWKYAGFASDEFRTAWAPYADRVLEARHDEPDWTSTDSGAIRRFLRSVCRVLVRLERERVFDVLNRTAEFKGLVRNSWSWESEEQAWERLASVRAELG